MSISLSGPELTKVDPALVASLQAIVSRLANKDATLWGPAAVSEARVRLGWIDSPFDIEAVLSQCGGLPQRSRTVLCGMGGSSLAPEVIAAAARKELVVLDSTDPQQVNAALLNLEETTFVVASKSGSTIETDSQRRAVEGALRDRGLAPKDHIVVVTDPNSPLDEYARNAGYYVVNADPNVGGRFSALTAFGVVPSLLIGADVSQLFADAKAATEEMVNNPSPAVLLAATMVRHSSISPYVTIASDERAPGFGDWVEQLVAESTGKNGKGILPIVVESADAVDFKGPDRLSISIGNSSAADLVIEAPLGALFVLWEWATAIAGYALEIDPFSQPNVAESKANTSALLNEWSARIPTFAPRFVEEEIEVFTALEVDSIADLLDQLTHHAGYLAVMAYLDRTQDGLITQLRPIFGRTVPCTFGWGPRFLHSTGQFHKGGPLIGSFLQITGENAHDAAIPGQEYSFARLQLAQALGDYHAFTSRDLPVARLHLRSRATGIATLIAKASHAS